MNRVTIELSYKVNSNEEGVTNPNATEKVGKIYINNTNGEDNIMSVYNKMELLVQEALRHYKTSIGLKDPEKSCQPGDETKCTCKE